MDMAKIWRKLAVLCVGAWALSCGSSSSVDPGPKLSTVTFLVTVPPETPVDASLYLTGEQAELGAWDPKAKPLTKGSDGRYTASVKVPNAIELKYRFTRGTEATAERTFAGATYTRTHLVLGDATLEVTVARWADLSNCKPTYTGTIKSHPKVGTGNTVGVRERDVLVWLPPGYDADPSRRYPVLYLHDGNNMFDSCTSFVTEWHADEIAQEEILAGRVEPLILVAVSNTPDRIADYTPVASTTQGGGNAGAYGRFLVEVVKPLIDSTYRTKTDAASTGVLGSSLGGLVSIYFALSRSENFTRFGVMSPSVWWADRQILTQVAGLAAKPAVRIWEDIGTAEGRAAASSEQTVRDARDLRDALLAKGWVLGTDLQYMEVDGALHNETAWTYRLPFALRFLFPPVP